MSTRRTAAAAALTALMAGALALSTPLGHTGTTTSDPATLTVGQGPRPSSTPAVPAADAERIGSVLSSRSMPVVLSTVDEDGSSMAPTHFRLHR